ncbi:hypothetical protein RHSIM_Rhsim13G0133200 [Rhododendron simsii]|uniref:RNase H type-1 domain-containing protein n=1 Tax=Rhododendron simsii TaxID=118357 RepID=A0A834L7X3_RHOSS|nr:hypothetical protein RHSIM_Rhsim13G0133200 [Rhododendron simsii]
MIKIKPRMIDIYKPAEASPTLGHTTENNKEIIRDARLFHRETCQTRLKRQRLAFPLKTSVIPPRMIVSYKPTEAMSSLGHTTENDKHINKLTEASSALGHTTDNNKKIYKLAKASSAWPFRQILRYLQTGRSLVYSAVPPRMIKIFIDRPKPQPEELPKEEPKPWVLQVDGSTTSEESGAGLILTSAKGQRLSYALRFEFKATNNEVEYKALVVGLELAKPIPREENIEADYLANLATAKKGAIPRNAPIRYLELPSIFAPSIQVQAINYSDSWIGLIVGYITNGALSDDKVKARQLKIRAAKYLMMGDVLYRRSFSLPYLRCLTKAESTRAMEEVHQGVSSIDHQENQEDLRAELDLLEETRETAMAKVAIYQQRMVKYHETQVRPRDFRAGDLVLRKVDPTGKKVGKLGPN